MASPRRALALALAALGAAFAAPAWWRRSQVLREVKSKSELELMAQLAVLLMPEKPIEELFRSFPAPRSWSREELLPDLASYGALQDKDAALFIEYDGHPAHERGYGDRTDRRKNRALLDVAPEGSVVVRIGHAQRKDMGPQVLYVQVPTWQRDEDKSLTQILSKICNALLTLREQLAPDTSLRLMRHLMENSLNVTAAAYAERRRFEHLAELPPPHADTEDDGEDDAAARRQRALEKLYKSWGA